MLDTLHVPADLRSLPASAIAVLLLATAGAVILAALAFEHIGGYTPCPLCLQQRYAYYLGIPAIVAALALLRAQRPTAAAAILLAVGVAFLANAGLGVYQAGAEWKFWDPPATCSAPVDLPAFDLKTMNLDRVPASCGVASWRFLGLSFAGWNAVASTALAAGAFAAALKATGTSGWRGWRRPG
ncbi:MAG TPA: disulfide bond formation protein B [Hyphomicrobiaceae bacterium]|jgi:disulfide bond formation protein DsbB|nr:disulfide bond formation protein B [Hyphomicrobiaceae bacterium]